MGMYTDYALKFSIETKDPDLIEDILSFMMSGDYPAIKRPLPDHPLFKTSRWRMMAKGSRSFKTKDEHFGDVDFMLIGAFKNYDDEIAKFIDWITPYLCDDLTGYSHDEGALFSTAYFVEALNY